MGRDKNIRKLYKKVLEENKRLEEDKNRLIDDIRILIQNESSPYKTFVESKWRKHFEKEKTFKRLWKEIQPGKDPGGRST